MDPSKELPEDRRVAPKAEATIVLAVYIVFATVLVLMVLLAVTVAL